MSVTRRVPMQRLALFIFVFLNGAMWLKQGALPLIIGLILALASITPDTAYGETCDLKCRRDPCLSALYFEREQVRLMISALDKGLNPAFLQDGLRQAQRDRQQACRGR